MKVFSSMWKILSGLVPVGALLRACLNLSLDLLAVIGNISGNHLIGNYWQQ